MQIGSRWKCASINGDRYEKFPIILIEFIIHYQFDFSYIRDDDMMDEQRKREKSEFLLK